MRIQILTKWETLGKISSKKIVLLSYERLTISCAFLKQTRPIQVTRKKNKPEFILGIIVGIRLATTVSSLAFHIP